MGLRSELRWSYRAIPESPSLARKGLGVLKASLDAAAFDRLALLVTELITNSIKHAGLGPNDLIEVRVELQGSSLHAQVSDSGVGFSPENRDVEPWALCGRGLTLLRKLAHRWGTTNSGSTVWFDLPVKQSPAEGRLR
jgi:two-component sensor histidine kinase